MSTARQVFAIPGITMTLKYVQRIAELIGECVETRMARGGLAGLSATHLEILSYLIRRGPATPAHIAEKIERTRPTVTVLVAKLEALGYCVRQQNPHDQRSYLISVTARGLGKRRLILAVYGDLQRVAAAVFTADEREVFEALTARLYREMQARRKQLVK